MILLSMYLVVNMFVTITYGILAGFHYEDNQTCFGFLLPIYYRIFQNELNLNLAGLIIVLIVITILTLPAILGCFMITLLVGILMMIFNGFVTLFQKK